MLNTKIYEQLLLISKRVPDNVGMIFQNEDKKFSYRDILGEVDKVTKSLVNMGATKGSHVALWGTNTSKWMFIMLASVRIGAVVVPINTNNRGEELSYILKQADIEFLFCMKDYREGIQLKTIEEIMGENLVNYTTFSYLKKVIVMDGNGSKRMVSWEDFTLNNELVSNEKIKELEDKVITDETSFIQYTSGTTTLPKGVMLSQYSAINVANSYGEAIQLQKGDISCLMVPFFHCMGNILVALSAVLYEAPIVVIDQFNSKKVMVAIEKEKCTILIGVPTMFAAMMSHPEFGKYDISSVKKIGLGGSICPTEIFNLISDKFNTNKILNGYGLTEAASLVIVTNFDDTHEKRSTTIGKKLANIDSKLIDPNTNNEVSVNEVGELIIKGYSVMKGYYNNKEKTSKVIDKDGWLHTGDLLSVDTEGYYSIHGRRDDLIIRGGENISPTEIESALLKVKGILGAQVVGIPNKKYGQEIAAFVLVQDNYNKNNKVLLNEIKNKLSEEISWFKIPKFISFMKEYPKTASGKVKKHELKNIAINGNSVLIQLRD